MNIHDKEHDGERFIICTRSNSMKETLKSENILFIGSYDVMLLVEKLAVTRASCMGLSINDISDNPSGVQVGTKNYRKGFAIIYAAELNNDDDKFFVSY